MNASLKVNPRLEELGGRSLPSVSLVGGVLTIGGTAGSESITVWRPTADTIQVNVSSTGEARRFNSADVNSIDLRANAGNDFITIGQGLTKSSTIRAGLGNDVVTGGGGDDTVFGSSGNDRIRGRNGNDDLHGDSGSDDIRGGAGDDSIDGGSGRDGCRGGDGDDDISNGMDLETELIANFTSGQGSAEFKFGPEDGGIEREFEVEVEDLAAGVTVGVFVDNAPVGSITTDAVGDGRLDFEQDFDSNHDGVVNFPAGFPEIHVGSVVQVRLSNGTVVREGLFVENPTP
jgi:Ca2+-binding RTX toxin-like protein